MKKLNDQKIGIFQYSSCNTSSIINALKMIKAKYFLSENFIEINQFSKIILPGVGNMKNIPQTYLRKMKFNQSFILLLTQQKDYPPLLESIIIKII